MEWEIITEVGMDDRVSQLIGDDDTFKSILKFFNINSVTYLFETTS